MTGKTEFVVKKITERKDFCEIRHFLYKNSNKMNKNAKKILTKQTFFFTIKTSRDDFTVNLFTINKNPNKKRKKMKAIPVPSQRRLVLLNRLLSDYQEKTITSQKIETLAGFSAALIRRDISLLGVKCGASNGYKVNELKLALEDFFSFSQKESRCCIVGLGRMGQILLDNTELENSPYKLVAGFDSNVNRTEILHSIFPLHPTTMLENVIQQENISYAILTVHKKEAQDMATRLTSCGIRGIVNYTPCILSVPQTVKVENVNFLTALEILNAECNSSA